MRASMHFDTLQLVALAAAIGWASGLRLYAVLFIVGGLGYLGWIDAAGRAFACSRIRACSRHRASCASSNSSPTRFPASDSLWDVVHTFIRIPAGAALAASVFGDSSSATMLAAAILGGTLAAGSHLAKAGSRAVINTSPEPFSNWAASFGEDSAVGTVLWLAFAHPIAALVVVLVLIVAYDLAHSQSCGGRSRALSRAFRGWFDLHRGDPTRDGATDDRRCLPRS